MPNRMSRSFSLLALAGSLDPYTERLVFAVEPTAADPGQTPND